MAGKVKMYNEDLDTIYLAPASAVDHYEERGWVVVKEDETEAVAKGKPRIRKTVSPRAVREAKAKSTASKK